MAITLRLIKGSELTFPEVDNNFKSVFYSSSLSGNELKLYYYPGNTSQSIDLSTFTTDTGSFLITGSVANGAITLTKGDGNSFDLIYNTGSFSGSFTGDGSGLTGVEPFPFTGSALITGSLGITGSFKVNGNGNLSVPTVELGKNEANKNIYSYVLNTSGGVERYLDSFPSGDGITKVTTPTSFTLQYNKTSPYIFNRIYLNENGLHLQSSKDSHVAQLRLSSDATGNLASLQRDSNEIAFVSSSTQERNYIKDGTPNQTGIEYFADYSATFISRSLVDKEYVDNQFINITASNITASNISASGMIYASSSLIGNPLYPTLTTTAKITATGNGNIVSTTPTSSYEGAFISYTVQSASNARAGTITSTWIPGTSNIVSTETATTDIGSTSIVNFTTTLSGSNMALTASVGSGVWTIKAIIKSI